MKMVISSGHGKYVRGASGIIDEVDEARRVVDRLAELIPNTVIFHDNVSTGQQENLERIVNFHNSQTRDLDVSVHFNAFEQTSNPKGTECWYYSQEGAAAKVSTTIADASGLIDRGAKQSTGLYFLNHTEQPAILIEVCFVDSEADCGLYERNFDEICLALSELATESVPPAQPEGTVMFSGRCSWFGGPNDTGVSPSEGLAFFYELEDAPHLFLPTQPAGTTGLARRLNPDLFYIACRWDYDVTPKSMLARPNYQALVRSNNREFLAWPADWGPHETETDKDVDISPGLMAALDIDTGDSVTVIYPAP